MVFAPSETLLRCASSIWPRNFWGQRNLVGCPTARKRAVTELPSAAGCRAREAWLGQHNAGARFGDVGRRRDGNAHLGLT
jgi:hypothetical protein